MDKGIRQGVNVKFAAMLPQLATLGGKAFRRQILDWTVEQYGVTMASASTHYNYSFHETKKATPELVAGLGRPEGKNNGGRKKKVAAVVVDTALTAEQAVEQSLLALAGQAAAQDTGTVDQAPCQADPDVQQIFKVCKKSDGTVVAEGLTFDDAKALVEKAKAAKKATLYYV